ncbi:YncE family protein [Neobacillus mesonae]|uniref:YncE family protein n=1 Tax=Neobacillus mesonae TaxID=1193713 RepID=UPI0025744A72|nr:hypothetical protein [Neobacillus mesonae]
MMRYKKFPILLLSLALVIFIIFPAHAEQKQAYTERVFVSGYGEVTVIDPAIPKVVASIKVDGPVRDMSFTKDGKMAVVNANDRKTLYVIDTVENKVIDSITLTGRTDKGLLDRRIWGAAVSPDGSKAYAFVTQGEKQKNIFKSLPTKILEIDLKTKEVTRDIEAPYGVHVLQFKENDPNTIFVWGYDLYTLDLKNWKISLKKGIKNSKNPEKEGVGGFLLLFPRGHENGFNSFPIIKSYPDGRVTEGIMWMNMNTGVVKSVEFDQEPVGMFSAVIDKAETTGYVILNDWYKVDLKTGKVLKKSKPPTGSIYGINTSTDEKKLYLAAAGNHFVVADRELNIEKIIELPTDGFDLRVVRIQK